MVKDRERQETPKQKHSLLQKSGIVKDRERSSLLQKMDLGYNIASVRKHPSKNTRSYRKQLM